MSSQPTLVVKNACDSAVATAVLISVRDKLERPVSPFESRLKNVGTVAGLSSEDCSGPWALERTDLRSDLSESGTAKSCKRARRPEF